MSPYATPAVLWVTSAIGLVVMLVGEGLWDALGLSFLCLPVVAVGRACWRGRVE